MQIEIVTIFPELFEPFRSTALVGKAIERGLFSLSCTNPRDFSEPPHFKVDDIPYGGGPGMVLKPEPLCAAIESIKKRQKNPRTILLSASGQNFTQRIAERLSTCSELIFVCGRYEGIDQRVIDLHIDEEISVGDYVVMGGEAPAMVLIESITRLIPGVLGNSESILNESFSAKMPAERLLESPHYTRPAEFRGVKVPEVLLSGNHSEIERWRAAESKRKTTSARSPKSTHS